MARWTGLRIASAVVLLALWCPADDALAQTATRTPAPAGTSTARPQGTRGTAQQTPRKKQETARKAERKRPSGKGSANDAHGSGGAPANGAYAPIWLVGVLLVVAGITWLLQWVFSKSAMDRRQRDVLAAMVGLYVLGMAVPPFLPLRGVSDWVVIDFVALMTSLGAAFFGFLFGLPQTIQTSGGPATPDSASGAMRVGAYRARPSTNLETVAEQLTKFITGAAFASIALAAGYIDRFGTLVAGSLTQPAPPAASIIGDMVLVGYATLGFTISYIVTRTELSLAFRQADAELLNEASARISEELPDIGPADVTNELRTIAKRIATIPFESLRYDEERLTWSRAQAIVGDWAKARTGYAKLYAARMKDPDIIIEYATAVYNDDPRGEHDLVLSLLKSAAGVAGTDSRRRSRIDALTAAAYLYVSGGYVSTIETVNASLELGVEASRNLRYYRACAFGQLYRAYTDARRLTKPDEDQITKRITNDSVITAAFGDTYRKELIDVVFPSKDSPEDDDLQAFASTHPEYVRRVLGVTTDPPPYPKPRPNGEPRLVTPLPGGKTPAQLAEDSPT